ncbi:odorant receptor 85b-like [Haematobia irritans]|uniref:odorant receptor 85b-like n=1 Tax=Haematobia irritans TaxID=7368 RepID=UPI003F4F72FD
MIFVLAMANTNAFLERSTQFENYINIPKFIYKFLGVDLTMKPENFSKYLQIAVVSNLIFVVTLQIIYNCTATDPDGDEELTANIIFANYNIVGFGKLLAIYYHRLIMVETLYSLRDIYPLKNFLNEYCLKGHYKFYSCLEFFIWLFYRCIGPTFVFLPLMHSLINFAVERKFSYLVPISMWGIPVGPDNSWIVYILSYITGGWCCFCAGLSITACDLLLYGLITQLNVHFDIISQKILQLEPFNEQTTLKEMNEITDYHRKVMGLAKNINTIFGPSIIFSVMSSSFTLCLVTYQMLDDVPISTVLKSLVLLMYESKQVVITCYMAQKVMEHVFIKE